MQFRCMIQGRKRASISTEIVEKSQYRVRESVITVIAAYHACTLSNPQVDGVHRWLIKKSALERKSRAVHTDHTRLEGIGDPAMGDKFGRQLLSQAGADAD